jgi:hypothetical protein
MANSFRADYLVFLPSFRTPGNCLPPSPGVGQHNERNNELTRQGGADNGRGQFILFSVVFTPSPSSH